MALLPRCSREVVMSAASPFALGIGYFEALSMLPTGSKRERASFEPSPAEYSEGSSRSKLTLTEPYELLHVPTRFDTQVMGRIA